MKPRIDVDMDSILVDLLKVLLDDYNNKIAIPRGYPLATPEQVTSWDLFSCFKDGKEMVGCFGEPDYFKDLPPIPGAVRGLRALIGLGYDVRIVSAATGHPTVPQHKFQWVRDHIPEFDPKNLVFAYRKEELTPPFMLIDDGPHNLEARRKASPETILATIDYAYNHSTPVDFRAMSYETPELAWTSLVGFADDVFPQHNRYGVLGPI